MQQNVKLSQIEKLGAVFHVSEVFLLHLEDVTEKKTLTDNAVSEKAQQIQSVMDNLSDADQRRVLAFAQNLAMTMQGSESETKNRGTCCVCSCDDDFYVCRHCRCAKQALVYLMMHCISTDCKGQIYIV